jgi:ubiquitin C-terminal hydrolase
LYVLRGFITFYGLHYIAYFYSEKFDTWYQFNDETISAVGCFKDVKKKCLAGR